VQLEQQTNTRTKDGERQQAAPTTHRTQAMQTAAKRHESQSKQCLRRKLFQNGAESIRERTCNPEPDAGSSCCLTARMGTNSGVLPITTTKQSVLQRYFNKKRKVLAGPWVSLRMTHSVGAKNVHTLLYLSCTAVAAELIRETDMQQHTVEILSPLHLWGCVKPHDNL